MLIDNSAKTNWVAIILLLVLTGIVGGAIYWWQNSQTFPEPVAVTIPTTTPLPANELKGWTETELVDRIYIKNPEEWGEKEVKDIKAMLDIGAFGPEAAPAHQKVGFEGITDKDFSYNIIYVSDLKDYKTLEEGSDFSSGIEKLKDIYDAQKVNRSDILEKPQSIEEESFNPNLLMPYKRSAATEVHDYGYIESTDKEYRGYWILATFHQEVGVSAPEFIAVITDKDKVLQFDFVIESKKIEEFDAEFTQEVQSSGNAKKLQTIQDRYFEFLSDIESQDSVAKSKIDTLTRVVKSTNSK